MDSTNIPDMNVVAKKTKSRQKPILKKISNKRKLQVSFAKRRAGIFKKASELSSLCGTEIAIIIFSPSNRVFSFGSPNVDSIIQRYTGWVPPPPINVDLNEADLTVDERELLAQLANLSNHITVDKKRLEDWDRLVNATKNQFWWVGLIGSMNMDQLRKFKKELEGLKTYINGLHEKFFS